MNPAEAMIQDDGDSRRRQRLINAAPDLLAALKRLLQANEADYEQCPNMDVRTAFETNSQAIKEAKEAITKATGR